MNPLNDIAEEYLRLALTLDAVKGGHAGEGGYIGATPFVEIGDNRGSFQRLYQGQTTKEVISTHLIVFYVPFREGSVDDDKKTLRGLVWSWVALMNSNETLDSLVYDSYPTTYAIDVTLRNNERYWYARVDMESRFEK